VDLGEALIRATLFIACALACTLSLADTGVYESEPNDTPENFAPISGEVTLYGTMVGQDQDGYLWTVTDNDARKRWTFRLNGEPGALTIAQIVRLEYADNGVDIAHATTLFKMGTRDGVTPSIHENLLFEPGEYVIGLAQAGAGKSQQAGSPFRPPVGSLSFTELGSAPEAGSAADNADGDAAEPPPGNAQPGAYRMWIMNARKITPTPGPKGRDSLDTAHLLRLGSEFSTFDPAETAWYRLTFNEEQAASRWDVRVQAPIGRDLRARLVDADGSELQKGRVSDKGKLRFPDLAPSAGTTWYLELTTTTPGFIHVVAAEAVGIRIAGEEAEPNGTFKLANRIDFGEPVTGRTGGDDRADYFRYTADSSAADVLRTLRLETDPPVRVQLCLRTGSQAEVNCQAGDSPVEFNDLALDEGDWVVSVDRAASGTAYTLSWIEQGAVESGKEIEPNDRIEFAKGIPDNLRIKGRFTGYGNDTDFYEILVSKEAQLWRFQVIGDEIFEVGYYDGSGHQKDRVRAASGQRRVRLDNLFLLPGRHYIRVEGRNGGSYTLLARPLGPPDPNGELEPNDEHNRQRLAIGQTRTGLSSDQNDLDQYRFFVGNWDHLRLTFKPPADGLIAPYVYWYDQIIGEGQPVTPGEPMVMQGLFPPGDYHIVLHPRQVSDAEYALQLERLPRFSCPADCEPNGHGLIWLASPLPADLVLEGISGDWRDQDNYELPAFDHDTELHIRTADPVRLSVGPHLADREWLTYDAELGGYRTTIPAGGPYRIMVESRGATYRLELVFPNGELTPISDPLPVALDLSLAHSTVSAFRLQGQRVDGRFVVTNTSDDPLDVQLDAVTSDYRWQVHLSEQAVTIPPGSNFPVGLNLAVPDDAWADYPVRISIRARDDTGRQAETWQEVAVDRDIPPVNPTLTWDIPESLRGGLNAAWIPFGGTWTEDTPKWARDRTYLRDGLVFDGIRLTSGAVSGGWKVGEENELTIDLPGDDPIPVAGTAVNHFGTPGPFFDVREATLLLSLDGESFQEVLHFEALPVETEQQFALAEPVPARFARLRIDSVFREASTARLSMAQWKVILAPGHDLSAGKGFNIADPEVGGHLVWDWPPEPYAPRRVVTPDDASKAAGMQRGDTKTYVLGFNQDRAAQITGIDWLYADDAREEWKIFDRIEVAVSLDSPIGPWLPLTELEIDPQTFNGTVTLDEPTWARFVRLTASKPPGSSTAVSPGQILVHERPGGADYLSVLGEWGTKGPRAFYELKQGLQPEAALVEADNTTRTRAAPIELASPVRGFVALGRQEHWYRMAVPPGINLLTLTMDGDPTVRTIVEMQDADGNRIPARPVGPKMTPASHLFEAPVESGSEVFFHVFEPPRNVAFSWDTSASVGAYIPMINNAIVAFSSQVVPGKEAVNLFPFPTGPLLKDWLGEPYMLQTILNDYRRPSSSSAAEVTLKHSTRELGKLPGTKAILVITDGDVNHDGGMWGEYRSVQPRVFAVQVAGGERIHHDLMRDWSTVNGGHFTQLVYQGEMEVAFDRAATLMHRPAGYTLLVGGEFREAPGPGLLSVIESAGSSTAGAAVELILDASGSMLQRVEGKRRISIAKDVLTEAVTQHIPAGTPVALRVFGHKEVDSCRTDLEIRLAPLNPEAAAAKIAGVNAMNLARTPIADSLKAVQSDLQGQTSGVVVLVTDGEETCDGDPGAVIDQLRSRGFDVSLNIVGFAIDDAALAAQFEAWAEQGGGRYFTANDQAGLSTAIQEALKVSYVVYDRVGNEVATGQVGGEPIELEQGIYSVLVRTQPVQRFEDVDVRGESELTLEVK